MNRTIVIGTRGSELALWQANYVKTMLETFHPGTNFELKVIQTTGDSVVDVALSKIGDKGLFTHQIEAELLDGDIDLAVHSLKDLQTHQPAGLTIGAVCEREVANDAFISRTARSISELPHGARVATGSLRRRSQLLGFRPDLFIEEIRGNVPTRLRKFDESDLDGIVLAYAGLNRLGCADRVTQLIPTDLMLPAVGQGAVAVEVREGDNEVNTLVSKLDHPDTRVCIEAERAFLKRLEGGCQVPIGGMGSLDRGSITLNGFVGSLDGRTCFKENISGPSHSPELLGLRLAERLLTLGAERVLTLARAEAFTASEELI
jgi:hydroxymethylbilane synthase